MSLVKVWNDNIHAHVEGFKGKKIEIPAGGFVEMDYTEAVEFRGQFTSMPPADCPEAEKAKYYKKIRVEAPAQPVIKDDGLTCHATGQQAATKAELAAMLAEYSHLRVVDPEAEKAVAATKRTEIDELREQVARLSALVEAQNSKKGPGRPKKEA
jgi:hypothetical protein